VQSWRMDEGAVIGHGNEDFPGVGRFYSKDPHGNRREILEPDSAA
jgi:hypothetical protein